jgi:hypothetical protein
MSMTLQDWFERLESDQRVIGIGEADREHEVWIFCDCRSVEAYEGLFDRLWDEGVRSLVRRGRASLWLSPATGRLNRPAGDSEAPGAT